ncbi:MAG: ribonuclease P protein component [Planktomarina sp.]
MTISSPVGPAPSGVLSLDRMKKRKDFVRASKGRRSHQAGFVLQGWKRGDDDAPRVGFTCSKKVGNAVARNRAKRRLRAIAADVMKTQGKPGWDYVLVGRFEATAAAEYQALKSQLKSALKQVHKK